MKLTDLDAHFERIVDDRCHEQVESIDDAQGIMFLCPKCYVANGGRVGTHMVLCWFLDRGVPADRFPGPGRWSPQGTGLSDLTLVAGSSSILLKGGCNWHGFIRNGDAT